MVEFAEQGMGLKLDQINDVISNLLTKLNVSRTEKEANDLIDVTASLCESYLDYNEEEYSYENGVQNNLVEKFQEILLENDRLLMQAEDYKSHLLREEKPLFEFLISIDQIKSLNRDTANLLANDCTSASLKIGNSYFILEPTQRPEKIIYFTEGSSGDENTEKCKNIQDMSFEGVKVRAQLEKEHILLARRQEKVRILEERLGKKIQEIENLKNEYYQKISDLDDSPVKGKKKSEDIYINHYSEPKKRPSDLSFIFKDFENTQKNLFKTSFVDSFISESSHNQSVQNISHIKPNPLFSYSGKNKENYIIDYIREQSLYQAKKIQELKEYETYLQETWVDAFGHDKAVVALQKASQKNFQLSISLKREREILDEKIMRLHKIQEITEKENQRLEFHRKKILAERNNLIKQQGDIENALEKIMNFAG